MADQTLNELEIPEGVHDAEQAVEVFRAWIADGALHVCFDPATFAGGLSDWGRLLADSAEHIAHASALEGGSDPAVALKEIAAGFTLRLATGMGNKDRVVAGRIKRKPVN